MSNGRGHPEAGGGPGVLGRTRAAGRLGEAEPGRARAEEAAAAPPSPAAHRTWTAPSLAPTRPSPPATRSTPRPPSARRPSSTWRSRTTSPAPGRCSAPREHQPAVHEHQHRRWCHRHPDRRPVHRLGAQVPNPVGRGPGQYYVDGTLVHTDNATFGSNLNVAASDFNSGGPGLSGQLGAPQPLSKLGHLHLARLRRGPGTADWGR